MKTKNKKITIDDLAGMIKGESRKTRSFVVEKIDDLAGMVQRGFAETAKNSNRIENNLSLLSENNTREHEEIKLRLDNVAYRFELVELQKRVEVLEKRAGVKKS